MTGLTMTSWNGSGCSCGSRLVRSISRENLRFVEESLGKDSQVLPHRLLQGPRAALQEAADLLMFSSPKGAFNALIYMHRYTPEHRSAWCWNEYLREFQAKLDAELANQARIAADLSASARDKARAEKESDKIRQDARRVERLRT